MNELFLNQELSKYNKYILDKIIARFDADREFNIYELIEESVLYKCILPSQNELVMDTYYTIKEFLVTLEFLIEQKEMSAYVLTAKGLQLKNCGSIERYEQQELKKHKRSIFHLLFKNKPKQNVTPPNNLQAEYYE